MSGAEIVSVAEKVVDYGVRIYSFYCSMRDAPQEIREYCHHLETLRSILTGIGTSVSKLYDVASVHSLGPEIILVTLRGCEAEFNSIYTGIAPLRTQRNTNWKEAVSKLSKSVRWLFQEEEIANATRRLSGWEQSLTLAMLMCGMNADVTLLDSLHILETRVGDYGNAIETQMAQLETSILDSIRQQEYRILQRVNDLSGMVSPLNDENRRRIEDLSDIFPTPPGGFRPESTNDLATLNSSPLAPHTEHAATEEPQDHSISDLTSDNFQDSPSSHTSSFVTSQNPPQSDLRSGETSQSSYHSSSDASLDLQKTLESDLELEEIKGAFYRLIQTKVGGQSDAGLEPLPVYGLQDTLRDIERSSSRGKRSKSSPFKAPDQRNSLTNSLESLSANSHGTSIIWEAAKLVLEGAQQTSYLAMITDCMQEMSEAFEVCQREYSLYPEAKIKNLIVNLYKEGLSGMTAIVKIFPSTPGVRRMIGPNLSDTKRIQESIENIRSCSQKVLREVEHLHRRELRYAHRRLIEVDRKQDQMMRALEEQKAILESLKEEQKLLACVTDYQRVLQKLQELLARFPQDVRGTGLGVSQSADPNA